jgi:hypothetical protein
MVAVTFATELYRRLTISLFTLVENKSVHTGSKMVKPILKQSKKNFSNLFNLAFHWTLWVRLCWLDGLNDDIHTPAKTTPLSRGHRGLYKD